VTYSRTDLPFFKPYTLSITDAYGESITLSEAETTGSTLGLAVNDYTPEGEPLVVQITGNFHRDNRQNAVEFLARLRGMVEISERENQLLLLIVPHPQVQMRGTVSTLNGPIWAGVPQPHFFSFNFQFTRANVQRQPKLMRPLTEVTTAEGKPYVNFTIPSADYTNVRELAYFYYGREYTDGAKIRKILELNDWSLSDSQSQSIGAVVKLPLGRGK